MKVIESKTFCIADLGCSSGPNALLPTENIIKSLEAKYLSAAGNIPVPQFQVFLNDLPSSDFNTLFRSLHPVSTDRNDPMAVVVAKSYFAAGVAGSFYERLFPDKSLHFVHSSFSLHWLCQVYCFHNTYNLDLIWGGFTCVSYNIYNGITPLIVLSFFDMIRFPLSV